jgi:hypothetical protein
VQLRFSRRYWVQHTVVGVSGVTVPATVAVPVGAHWPPEAVTLAVTLRAVAVRLPLHWFNVVETLAGDEQLPDVADTDTLLSVHVTAVGPPQPQAELQLRESVACS